ncbi:MAG: nuclear transport factor 2 family protein [Xanthobacteraceae bacterium]|uniref:nuclear transport factor 2 family protein n=1 Tax=Pseudolabrys sp. TaxID=1960880 RepID=UPI003D0FD71D
MDTEATRAVVGAIYDAYERRDFETVAAHIDEDIDWIIYAPVDVFPFAGPRRGRRDVLTALAGIAELYAIESYRPEQIVVDGDRAAVMSDVRMVQRTSGRTMRFRVANFLRLKDGRVVEFREFMNTLDVAEQALGHFIVR